MWGFQPRRHDLNRPQDDWIARAKSTGYPLDRSRVQYASAFDLVASREFSLASIERELNDRHRGYWREVMRVEHIEQRLCDFRKLIIYFQANAPGQERKGFNHPLDVRVLALVLLQ